MIHQPHCFIITIKWQCFSYPTQHHCGIPPILHYRDTLGNMESMWNPNRTTTPLWHISKLGATVIQTKETTQYDTQKQHGAIVIHHQRVTMMIHDTSPIGCHIWPTSMTPTSTVWLRCDTPNMAPVSRATSMTALCHTPNMALLCDVAPTRHHTQNMTTLWQSTNMTPMWQNNSIWH